MTKKEELHTFIYKSHKNKVKKLVDELQKTNNSVQRQLLTDIILKESESFKIKNEKLKLWDILCI